MRATTIEDVVPGLRAARAAERQNRALAFSSMNRSLLGVEVVPLTPNHRLHLQLIRNAFSFPGVRPLEGDVFIFLWCLSARHPHNGGRFGWLEERRIRKLAKRIGESPEIAKTAANYVITSFLADQLQDSPEASSGGNEIPSNYVHWMAAEAGFWINVHSGFTLESYRRTPYLVLQQLMRVWRCNHPNVSRNKDGSIEVEQPHFINASDRLLGDWQRARSKEIGEMIRNRNGERLPN